MIHWYSSTSDFSYAENGYTFAVDAAGAFGCWRPLSTCLLSTMIDSPSKATSYVGVSVVNNLGPDKPWGWRRSES